MPTDNNDNLSQPLKLKRNILLPFSLALAIFLVVFILTLKGYHLKSVHTSSETKKHFISYLLDTAVKHETDMMLEIAELKNQDINTKELVSNKDREALLNQYTDHFEHLKEDHNITHFYFHDSEKINIVRLHKPDRFGDKIKRHTANNAKKTDKPAHGLELGPLGTFTLRVVVPLHMENKTIGFVELGKEIEYITELLANTGRSDLAVIINKGKIDRERWESGMRMLGRVPEWDLLPSSVLTFKTDESLFKKFIDAQINVEISEKTDAQSLSVEGRDILVSQIPLRDASGVIVGALLVFDDVTIANMLANRASLVNASVGLFLALLLFMLFYIITSKTEKKLLSSQNKLIAETNRRVDMREQHILELEDMLLHDPTTKLPTRTYLINSIREAIASEVVDKGSFAILAVSIHRLREIIDTLGHEKGDTVIIEVNHRLKEEFGESATIARLISNLLGIMIEAVERDNIPEIIQRITKCLEKPFVIDDCRFHIEVTTGVSFFPEHGKDTEILLQRADVANRLAKFGHSSFAIYDEKADPYSKEKLALLSELRHAIDNAELELYYQPKVDLKTGKVKDVEALVRWIHPQNGIISAGDFIPLAEQSGLIHSLTEWVFKEGVRQQQQWHRDGLDLRISMNISAHILADSKFPGKIRDLLDETKIEPSRLIIEVTESAMMADPQDAAEMLSILNGMGISISIDDYGTGYSSLSYLSKLPVGELKIDRSFVSRMNENSTDDLIIRSTIDLGKNLGLKVIAEGVEKEIEWEKLSQMGCDMIQGYYVCRPIPANDFVSWLSKSKWA